MDQISPFPPHRVRFPAMVQRWRFLTFFHWRYEPASIRKLLPKQVTLDTFDGGAWIGLTPFLLTDLRPPFLPGLPWLSRFPEINVRTYVHGPEGEPGVWFFTLEADRLLAVAGARASYKLPYRWSRMHVNATESKVNYQSRRHSSLRPAKVSVSIKPGEPIRATEFDNFLTARFRLYTVWRDKLLFAQIEHAPWDLYRAEIVKLQQDLIQGSGVPGPVGHPTVHYAPDTKVRIGGLQTA